MRRSSVKHDVVSPEQLRQYLKAELEVMVREMGGECKGDVDLENTRAIEWIGRNAARFRAQWDRAHPTAADPWTGTCSGVN